MFVHKDRKSLFRQFLAGMYDAVVITDPNGHIIEINPRAVEHFGYESDEVVDKPISFYIPGLTAAVVQRVRNGLKDDRHMVIDAGGKRKDGGRIACEVMVSVVDLANPGDLVFTIRNVEKRRNAMNVYRAKANVNRANFPKVHPSDNAWLHSCHPQNRYGHPLPQSYDDSDSLHDWQTVGSALSRSYAFLFPLPAWFLQNREKVPNCQRHHK